MSKKTVSQMEAVLMDKIQKAKEKLDLLQEKHQLKIGHLAYKHGLNQIDLNRLDSLFAKLAHEVIHGHN
ncbi:hypothetical protein [Legionella genomosp. 1]|uniref:hypothetical protein n=1 Tax=Legionella genomosp. 1 TaxID=1093625 RepID=UPI0010555ACF|nr:hypothetical protein [Legionella genomosp. 1]